MNFLAGDIGGTKTLLGIFKWEDKLIKLHQHKYHSSEWNSLEPMLLHFLENLPTGVKRPESGCLALAGPVINGKCNLTNLGWKLEEKEVNKIAKLNYLELINDVCVLIYGIPFLNKNQFIQVQHDNRNSKKQGKIAVIASGTGLGIARGLCSNEKILSFASEGGHREFAARSTLEWELSQWLKSDLNLQRLSIERVISGNGLGQIARWRLNQSDVIEHHLKKVSELWPLKTDLDLPALVSKAAKNGDKTMKEVVNIWLSAYGSAAGDLALQELCTGGLWISGGTTAKQIEGIRSATFLNAMKNKGRFYDYLEELPVMAIVDPEAGLFSAACRARMHAE